MTELTVLLSPSSTNVTSVVDDIQPVTLTLSVVNNDSTAADVSGGLMIEFAADPGISTTAGMNGPVEALLAANFTVNPDLKNPDGTLPPVTLLRPAVTAAPAADSGWAIDSGSLVGAILVFTASPPNGTAPSTLLPGGSITFTFSDVSVDTVPGVSTVTVSVLPSILPNGIAATIGTQPQIQKTAVPLRSPSITAHPSVLNPPSSETTLTWSNDGAASCELSWDSKTGTVVSYGGATVPNGWNAPLVVTADTPAIATLLETDAFTLTAYGATSDGMPSPAAQVVVNPPEFAAITEPPVVTGVWPPRGDPAGGQQITITGTGLTATSAVTLTPVGAPADQGVPATSVTVVSDSEVTATTPPGTGLADVILTTPVAPVAGSPVVPADIFTYAPAGTPVVSGVSPTYGTVDGGDQVTITGTGLSQATSVTFIIPPDAAGVSTAMISRGSDSELTVTTPAGAGATDITVTAGSVTSPVTPAGRYTYIPPGSPLVTGVVLTDPAPPGGTPPARPPGGGDPVGGQPVTITGTGLADVSAVTFVSVAAGTSASATGVTPVSGTQVTATTPAGSGVVDIIVTANGQDSPATPADRFGYGIQATMVPPYQPFQLIWSCYQGWNRGLSWQLAGDSAGGPNPPVVVSGDTTLDSVRAIVTINRGARFTLTLPPGSQALPDLPVNVAPVELSGFASTVPVWNPATGEQTVTLTWDAAYVVGFSLAQDGSPLPQQPTYDQRNYTLSLPLSGPVTYTLTAYGYDQSGTAQAQLPQSVQVTPLPVSVGDVQVTDPQVIDAVTGTQRVTVSWQAANAAGFDYGGPGAYGTLGPSATSLELDLPQPPAPPGPISYVVVIAGQGYVQNEAGRTNEVIATVVPHPVQLNSFTASTTQRKHPGQVTLSWSARYATGFSLGPGLSYPANATQVTVDVFSTTTYTLTAQGYPPGAELPQIPVTVTVLDKETDKHGHKENQLEFLPGIPGGPVPPGASPFQLDPPGDQAGGQQAFIRPDERPDASAPA